MSEEWNNQDEFEATREKLDALNALFFPGKTSMFGLRLSEIYCRSKRLTRMIEDMCQSVEDHSVTGGRDMLLTHLVNMKIEIYDEISDWMKNLREPLDTLIDAVSETAGDDDGAESDPG